MMTIALTVAMMAAQDPSSAGTADLHLNIVCTGQHDVVRHEERRIDLGSAGRSQSGRVSGYTMDTVPARLSVVIRDGEARVKVPPGLQPMLGKAGEDGWWPVQQLAVSDTSIRGVVKLGLISSPRLLVDRLTGDATFGSFTGVCEKAPEEAQGRRF